VSTGTASIAAGTVRSDVTVDVTNDVAAGTPTPAWLTPAEQHTWRSFLSFQRILLEELDADIDRTSSVSLSDFEILVHLSEGADNRLRMSELAKKTVAPKSRLTYRIDQLVARGWVERVECESDRRGLFAAITLAGQAVVADAAPGHVASVRSHFFDHLSQAEVVGLGVLMNRLIASSPRR
jgi:DNA-binding MarR family transcriptional regulator